MADPYFSELKYLGGPTLDFIEVAVDAGTDVSSLVVTIYHSNGTIRSTNDVSGLSQTTVAGKDVYVIESGSPNSFSGLAKNNAVSLSDDDTVFSFVSFDDTAATVTASAGPAFGLTSTDIGQAGSGQSLETTDGGASYQLQTDPNSGTIPCLTNGTRIQTVHGEIMVENLQIGAKVRTLGGSFRPLRKVMCKTISVDEMIENPKLVPIRICAGALGVDLPKQDILVSRQHRMLVSSRIAKRMFGEQNVLVAAIKLTKLPGVYLDNCSGPVEYFHLLFDEHQIIFAEGAPTESLYLGTELLNMLSPQSRSEVLMLFPDLRSKSHAPTSAAQIPKGSRQARLILRHSQNKQPVLGSFPDRFR